MKKEDGQFKNIFFQTKGGQLLRKLIEDGLELKRNDYYIDYAYSMVPKVISRDKAGRAVKYKPPKQTEANGEYDYLFQRIVKEKPDIIVPTGNIGCKALIGKSAITSLRGVPEKVTVKAKVAIKGEGAPSQDQNSYGVEHTDLLNKLDRAEEELDAHKNAYPPDRLTGSLMTERDRIEEYIVNLQAEVDTLEANADENENTSYEVQTHECWVLPMYSMEYMLVNPSIQNLVEADFVTLKKFVEEGDTAFEASPVDYEFVTDIDRVRSIFTDKIPNAPITAWDLETNTLHPELDGAKPLVISLSWKEGEGVTIPLEHKDHTWNVMELAEVYKLTQDFVADPNIIKVGHNLQYDIRFLRLTKGFIHFANHRDTKVMYYLLINQDVESSFQLSDLAYELTDMGGYDKALDEYKKKFIKDYVEAEKERIGKMKAEHKEKVKQEKEEAKERGEKYTPEKVTFPKAEAPKNEVDGSDFNYEWIPLIEMLHPYASGDVDACLRIYNRLHEIGKKKGNERLQKLYMGHYPELVSYLSKIEANGVKMDVGYNEMLTDAYITEEDRLIEEMRKFPAVKELEDEHRQLYEKGLSEWAVPKQDRDEDIAKLRDKYKKKLVFNPNSSDDKKKVLFDIMGVTLPYNKEHIVDSALEDGVPEEEIEWFHYKTNKTALEYIKNHFEESASLADIMLTHSLVKTRKQGFTYKLRKMIDQKGFLHGGFNPTGTATSRLSSQSPNLQQLPSKTGNPKRFDYRYPIKRMFTTSFENGALLQLDYSSLESRVLGLAAMDEEMTQAFLDGKDLHKETATFVYGVPVEEVTGDMRQMAKAVTFGLAYGKDIAIVKLREPANAGCLQLVG
jgi:DNA polymerase I-like protein with 3'-5' exonuclease and polymerase domains/uracil-DNA glycosylase